jgi:hypothetical protein
VLHPAVVLTVVLAWLAALAVCVAAVLFGQTSRRRGSHAHRRSRRARVGLFLSLSGPWLALVAACTAGAITGAWLPAAALGAAGVVLVALVGLTLDPR